MGFVLAEERTFTREKELAGKAVCVVGAAYTEPVGGGPFRDPTGRMTGTYLIAGRLTPVPGPPYSTMRWSLGLGLP